MEVWCWIILVLVIYLKMFGFCFLSCMNWIAHVTANKPTCRASYRKRWAIRREKKRTINWQKYVVSYGLPFTIKTIKQSFIRYVKDLKMLPFHKKSKAKMPKAFTFSEFITLILVSRTHIHRHILYSWKSCYSCRETLVMVLSLVIDQDLLIYSSTV